MITCCCEPAVPCGCTFPASLSVTTSPGELFFAGFASHPYADPAHPTTHGSYALTYQDLPGDMEVTTSVQVGILSPASTVCTQPATGVFNDYVVTMPAAAWFSDPFPITAFGNPGYEGRWYFWVQGCTGRLSLLARQSASMSSGPGPWLLNEADNGCGGSIATCTPFLINANWSHGGGPAPITGTHGGDDLTTLALPCVAGLGGYFNHRCAGSAFYAPRPVRYEIVINSAGSVAHGHTAPATLISPGAGNNQLRGGYTPVSTVVWSSSDTSVLTVVGAGCDHPTAVMTGVSAGTATVTATLGDPDACDSGLSPVASVSKVITVT